MANITKRNNTYRITVSLGRDSNDNQIRKTTTYIPKATTPKAIEKEVKLFADRYEEQVRNGEVYSGETLSVKDFSEIWRENYLERSTMGESSKRERLSILNNKILPDIGHLKLSKVKATHIDNMLNKVIDKGLSVDTVNKLYVTVKSIFDYAFRKDYIKDNPILKVDKPKRKQKENELHYFTVEQAKRFLNFLDEPYTVNFGSRTRIDSKGNSYHVKPYSTERHVSSMFKAYFNLAIFGGLRRGENCALTWEDLDFNEGTVSINKAAAKGGVGEVQIIKSPKTIAGIREIALPTQCLEALKQWRADEIELSLKLGTKWQGFRGDEFDKNYIFIDTTDGTIINLHTPSKKFKKLLKFYNNTVDSEDLKLPIIRLHDLRHTSATLLLANNVDIETVSHRLGHSKASITLDVYGHAMESMDRVASNVMEGLFANA